MGYIYVGGKTNQRINGYGKVGETNQKYLSQRITTIRCKETNFFVFEYLEIPNSTKALTRAVEGYVRWKLECAGYHNIQNDHFEWTTTIENKMSDYHKFANLAMFYAEEFCTKEHINYTRKQGNPKARKTVKRKK